MTLNAKIGGFMDFLAILGCDTSLYQSINQSVKEICIARPIIHKVVRRNYRYAIQIENLVFVY